MNQNRRVALVLPLLAGFVSMIFVSTGLAAGAAADDVKLPAKEHFKIFLLIGQSNMAGRGAVGDQDKQPNPRVFKLDKQDHWVPAVDPLHFDKPAAGVGPGLAFGKALAKTLPEDTIGLVPCAVGGTSIEQWKPGGKLYKAAVGRANVALRHGELAGILWHQGESDSAAAKVAAYPKKAAELFAELRKDLTAPDVPVVIGTLGDFRGDRSVLFNAMARKLPDTIPHCGVVDAAGLKDRGDHLHFDSASARELGRRYAKVWLMLAGVAKQ